MVRFPTAVDEFQRAWYDQVKSDHDVLLILRRNGANACHQLHYIQMVAEKLGKAYLWMDRRSPGRGHAVFVQFLKRINLGSKSERLRVAKILGFGGVGDLDAGLTWIMPIAYEVERLAPALAGDSRPNPEYPWPIDGPVHSPATFDFPIWADLRWTGRGRRLSKLIDDAVAHFEGYA